MMSFNKHISFWRWLLVCLLVLVASCSLKSTLKPFRSDGCSLFPDKNLISGKDWCDCCFAHDISYWQGGTEAERKTADSLLHQCVLSVTSDTILAKVMYDGVRFGGAPYFPNWYRWGYGWPFPQQYAEHTAEQKVKIQAALLIYDKTHPTRGCTER